MKTTQLKIALQKFPVFLMYRMSAVNKTNFLLIMRELSQKWKWLRFNHFIIGFQAFFHFCFTYRMCSKVVVVYSTTIHSVIRFSFKLESWETSKNPKLTNEGLYVE